MLRRLESHEVFRLLRPEQLRAISDAAEEVAFGSGRTVFRQGDKAEFFFVVFAGKVALRLPQAPGLSLEIDVVRPGEVFGSCLCFQLDSYAGLQDPVPGRSGLFQAVRRSDQEAPGHRRRVRAEGGQGSCRT